MAWADEDPLGNIIRVQPAVAPPVVVADAPPNNPNTGTSQTTTTTTTPTPETKPPTLRELLEKNAMTPEQWDAAIKADPHYQAVLKSQKAQAAAAAAVGGAAKAQNERQLALRQHQVHNEANAAGLLFSGVHRQQHLNARTDTDLANRAAAASAGAMFAGGQGQVDEAYASAMDTAKTRWWDRWDQIKAQSDPTGAVQMPIGFDPFKGQ